TAPRWDTRRLQGDLAARTTRLHRVVGGPRARNARVSVKVPPPRDPDTGGRSRSGRPQAWPHTQISAPRTSTSPPPASHSAEAARRGYRPTRQATRRARLLPDPRPEPSGGVVAGS